MARAAKPTLVKIAMTDRGEDTETPWAEDLGPAKGKGLGAGARKVRLVNVPFFHAKPTCGDVIVVEPDEEGFLTWDRKGVPWAKIGTRIAEDSGRWAMIVDYLPKRGNGDKEFKALAQAADDVGIIPEGSFGPHGGEPGRIYLAVPHEAKPAQVMVVLEEAKVAATLTQVHPAVRKKPVAKKKAPVKAKKPVAKKKAPVKAKKPAAKKKAAPAKKKAALKPKR